MSRRRNAELWWILGAGVGAAVLTPFVVESLVAPPREIASAPAVSRLPQLASVQPVTAASTPPQARPDLPPIKLVPPFEVSDGLTILTERLRVRLAGLEGPAKEAACFDPSGSLWGCGLQARAALNNLIRAKEVVCRPTGEKTARPTGEKVVETPVASCTVDGVRLERALVAQGFARPIGEDASLARDVADAKAAGRGLWNGGWRVRAP